MFKEGPSVRGRPLRRSFRSLLDVSIGVSTSRLDSVSVFYIVIRMSMKVKGSAQIPGE